MTETYLSQTETSLNKSHQLTPTNPTTLQHLHHTLSTQALKNTTYEKQITLLNSQISQLFTDNVEEYVELFG